MIKTLPLILFSTLSAVTLVACADATSEDKMNINEKKEVTSASLPAIEKSNCVYDEDKSIMISQRIKPLGPYQIGDYIAIYGDNVIGIESPINKLKLPDGLSKGKYVESFGEESYFELCGDNLEKYPHLELAEVNIPDTSPAQAAGEEDEEDKE